MLQHEFVGVIPADRREGTLYVSIPYATVVHQCCCGCGTEVVTPLSPTDWKLVFDGETVSLDPSIGNWGFVCESHYWISRSRVYWARKWTPDEIAEGRRLDRNAKYQFYADPGAYGAPTRRERAPQTLPARAKNNFLRWLRRWRAR